VPGMDPCFRLFLLATSCSKNASDMVKGTLLSVFLHHPSRTLFELESSHQRASVSAGLMWLILYAFPIQSIIQSKNTSGHIGLYAPPSPISFLFMIDFSQLTPFPPLQIRLLTTQNASADTIRLWLERSGDSVPLDIEIFLRVRDSPECPPRRRRRSLSPTDSPPPLWTIPLGPPPGLPNHYVLPPHQGPPAVILPPAQVPIILPPSPGHHDPWSPDHQLDRSVTNQSRISLHWGHIAIYYLVEQMHRWERFVFRFDKQFISMGALKSISGKEISSSLIPRSPEVYYR